MIEWSDLKFVLETVRQGGITSAARSLGVNHATVSRRISAAEQACGARLFDRLPSGYRATEAGLEVAKAAEKIERETIKLNSKIGALDMALKGPLTFTAPELIVRQILGPILSEFQIQFPGIDLQLIASTASVSLTDRTADVAINVSNTPHQSLIGTKVSGQKCCAYIAKTKHKSLASDGSTPIDWIQFSHRDGIPKEVTEAWPNQVQTIVLNDMTAAHGLVRSGLGATVMPCFLGDTDPELTGLPNVPLMPYVDVWVLTHADLKHVPRISAFTRFVSDHLRALRPVFMGEAPDKIAD
ncbi:MAG: LysR family transcriptional regulator [Henriciella sp.]|nr:LysR family transcriptional regulator [Henriciella sp.]